MVTNSHGRIRRGLYLCRSIKSSNLGNNKGEGNFTVSKKRTRFFLNKRILTEFWWIFLENKRIFGKGVRDFLGVKCPSNKGISCKFLRDVTGEIVFKETLIHVIA